MKKEKSLIKECVIELVCSAAISALAFIGMEVAESIWLNVKSAKKGTAKPKKSVIEKITDAVRNCIIHLWKAEKFLMNVITTKLTKKRVNEKTKEAVRNCIVYPWENE